MFINEEFCSKILFTAWVIGFTHGVVDIHFDT